ncbi:hypothetical protein [Streptomyces sp. NPDC054784]
MGKSVVPEALPPPEVSALPRVPGPEAPADPVESVVPEVPGAPRTPAGPADWMKPVESEEPEVHRIGGLAHPLYVRAEPTPWR